MRVFIKSDLVLTQIRRSFFDESFEDMLVRQGIEFCATSTDSTYMKVRLIVPENGSISLNLPDHDAKIFYNTLAWGTDKSLKFEYLGDMRFILHVE